MRLHPANQVKLKKRSPLVDPRIGDRVRIGCNKKVFREVSSRAGGWVRFDFWDGERWGASSVMRLKVWRGICQEFGTVVYTANPTRV